MPNTFRRHRTKIIAAVVAVLLVTVIGPWVYIHVIQDDPPERLSIDDVATSTTSSTAGDATSSTGAGAVTQDGIDGTWKVGDGSKAGYRVKEVLFGQDAEAVGRTSDVTGTLAVSGTTVTAAEISVDMTSVTSSESQRDGQFQGRIMSTDQFPTATFTLTKPIDLGTVPAEGDKITVEATGDLTVRGVTRSVTAELHAVRQAGTLVVDGSITVDFDDFDIPDASGGPASVGRTGTLELLLVFGR